MTPSAILVTLGGLLAIAAIVWWFWLSAPQGVKAAPGKVVDIRVEGGAYQPGMIEAAAGQPLTLRFLRIDATPCAEKVIFAELDLQADLPLSQPITVTLPPLPPGTHEFTCQMGMYRGKVIAK